MNQALRGLAQRISSRRENLLGLPAFPLSSRLLTLVLPHSDNHVSYKNQICCERSRGACPSRFACIHFSTTGAFSNERVRVTLEYCIQCEKIDADWSRKHSDGEEKQFDNDRSGNDGLKGRKSGR